MLTASEADIFSGGRDSNVLAGNELPDSSRGHLLSQADNYGNRITGNTQEPLWQTIFRIMGRHFDLLFVCIS